MRTTLFQAFRTRDGRSLGRAMAVLLVLNALVLGFNGGVMAADAGLGISLCAASAEDGGTPVAPPGHDRDCCLAGCPAAATAIAPGAAVLPSPPLPRDTGTRAQPSEAPTPPVRADAAPRGPPVLA